MRNADTVEVYWRSKSGGWLAGVMARTDTRSTMSVVRVPFETGDTDANVTLETVVFRPPGPGPFPALVLNHGSTGEGNNLAVRKYTAIEPAVARFFTERGWLVAFPQRRGRGNSDGEYREGLTTDGSGYSRDPQTSLAASTMP